MGSNPTGGQPTRPARAHAVPGAGAVDAPGAAVATSAAPTKEARAYVVTLKQPVTDVFKGISFVDGVGVLWYEGLASVRPEYFKRDGDGLLQPKPGGITLYDIAKHLYEEGCGVRAVLEPEAEHQAKVLEAKLSKKRNDEAIAAKTVGKVSVEDEVVARAAAYGKDKESGAK